MEMKDNISFCITTYSRFEFTVECVSGIINHPSISEIVISDDYSTDGSYEKLCYYFSGNQKVKIFRNASNKDCYVNKKIAIELSTNKQCIIADSDNKFGWDYVDKILEQKEWNDDMIYMPSFARESFDYRHFTNLTIDKSNVAQYMDAHLFQTMLNTFNFFVNREKFLQVWDGAINPVTFDSIYFCYCWLNAGKKLKVVDGLEYQHRVHSLSHYQTNRHLSGDMLHQIESKLKSLR
jgi:glycosyltransferase involved in cell wall biosynthesis